MKKFKYRICVMLAVITGFSSCNFLDLEPEDGVILDRYWQTKEDVFAQVMGCYAAMMNSSVMQQFFWWGENRAEMAKSHETRINAEWLNIQNGELSPTNAITSWAGFYSVINNCNTILQYAGQVRDIDQSFSEELLKEYEAEAVCVRSLMYFYLVRTFGDVPYITAASTSDDQEYMIPKSPKEAIIDSLIVSLKKVDRTQNGTSMGIPFSYEVPAENKGRFTVWSLKALLADIYLWKEDYQNCLNECNLIINSGQYSLFPVSRETVEADDGMGNMVPVYYPSENDIDNLFLALYGNGNSVESILELQFAEDLQNPFYGMFSQNTGYIVINNDYLSEVLFVSSNVDRGWFDVRTQGVSYRQGYVWKWLGLDRTTSRESGRSFSNWIFYRLPDVILMKAEALNQLGKQSGDQSQLREALNLVYEIRDRATAPESTELIKKDDPADVDADILEEFILQERGRELAYEGKRWYDVLRNAKRNNYGGIRFLETLAIYAASPDKAIGLQNKWKGDYGSHYYPINNDELRRNKALVQNPFYAQ